MLLLRSTTSALAATSALVRSCRPRASAASSALYSVGTATARQLVCRHGPGKFLEAGAPLGMPRIGGMTELFLPAASRLSVRKGQSVVAGETIIAALPR